MARAASRWAEQLGGWAIPPAILEQAPEPPWGFLPGMFVVDEGEPPDLPSRLMAREPMPDGGSVLDVGCGGGAASLALVPPAGRVIGVDERAAALEDLSVACAARPVACQPILGAWPAVAAEAPIADVVVCHHVFFNVADLDPFVAALTAHARHRVVVELSATHPLVYLGPLWLRFWGLDRPEGPMAAEALAVLHELGLQPEVAVGRRPAGHWRTPDQQVRLARKRLCLPAGRDAEVAEALSELPPASDEVWAFAWPGAAVAE